MFYAGRIIFLKILENKSLILHKFSFTITERKPEEFKSDFNLMLLFSTKVLLRTFIVT